MKNQFVLEINLPCLENFDRFTPTKTGGFCDSCQKNVVDFTKMNSHEIIHYFKINKGKNTCGRFNRQQLRNYIEPKQQTSISNFWKRIGLASISLLSTTLLNAQEVKTAETTALQKNSINQQQKLFKISGTVIDEAGPLPGVHIILKGTNIGAETDFDGNFEFPKKLNKGDVLIISFVGYESQKVIIDSNSSSYNINLKVNMKSDSCVLLGKVAVKKIFSSKKSKK